MAPNILQAIRILTALVLALGLFGCDNGTAPPPFATVTPVAPVSATPIYNESQTYRVISSLPHKGYAALQTRQIEQAIQLALEGKSQDDYRVFEYIALDSSDDETGEWSRAKETENIERAVADPRVVAYIGPYTSGAAAIVLPIANASNLLVASPSVTWPGLSLPGYNSGEPDIYYPNGTQNFIGMMPDDSQMGMAAAQWARKLGFSRLMIINDGSTYSEGIAKTALDSLRDMLPISATITPDNLASLDPYLSTVDAVFYAPSSINNALALAKRMAEEGKPVISTDVALDPQFLEGILGQAAQWYVVSNSVPQSRLYDDADELSTRFRADFEQSYGSPPGQFAVNAYNIATRLTEVVQPDYARDQPGGALLPMPPDRGSITRAVRSTDEEGLTTRLYFNYTGRPKLARMSGYELVDGRFSLSEMFTVSRP